LPPESTNLIALAESRRPADRERLLMGVVALCERGATGHADLSLEESRALIDQVFMALVVKAEADVRRRLAERIADAPWAPKALVNILALDDIEIARPIIAESPILKDADLIGVMVKATLEHQIEVARRANIAPVVVEAILERGEPAALAALARNESAQLPSGGIDRLVDFARRLPDLRAPLTRHPALTEDLGVRLYAWVGEALRSSLAQRFQLDEAALALAINGAVDAAASGAGLIDIPRRSAQNDAVEQTLVEKLDAAGQLKPGYLLRALREHRLSLFEASLARLAGLDAGDLRRALASDRPELLALACMAAGIDRSVFAPLLATVRELNHGHPDGGPGGLARAMGAFKVCPPNQAANTFRRILALI
jgi:uncharacterized protein (DUF2336 family)